MELDMERLALAATTAKELDGTTRGDACEILGAQLDVLRIQQGDIVTLSIPKLGNRWNAARINKLAGAVRKRGGELAVVQDGTTIIRSHA